MPRYLKNTKWDDYVNELLFSGSLTKAGIFGMDGKVWAISEDFEVLETEAELLAESFHNPSTVCGEGMHLDGITYAYMPLDTLKKTADFKSSFPNGSLHFGKRNNKGCIVAKGTDYVIVALFDDFRKYKECDRLLAKFVEYLKTNNI